MKTLYAIKLTKADVLKIGEGAEPHRATVPLTEDNIPKNVAAMGIDPAIENAEYLDIVYYLADSDDENDVTEITTDEFYLYDDFYNSDEESVLLHSFAPFPFGAVIEFVDRSPVKVEAVEMQVPADTFKLG